MTDLVKIRRQLNSITLKTFTDLEGDMSNIDDILDEYRTISRVAKDLIKLNGKELQEALTHQASEYYFFRMCLSNLKVFVDYFDSYIKYRKGKEYYKIIDSHSRDLNDRAINQLIDASDDIFRLFSHLHKVREVHDTFYGIIESYNQRGYSLNNITKALEAEVISTIL